METQTKSSAKDFFINLGAIVALYTAVISLINLLFTAINTAYPKIINGYNYFGSSSISWPVATLIIFCPIFLFLMWLLEREYRINPDKQNSGVHRWLTYITLFLAGLTVAIDLITILYYFIDGQELTTGFILKVLVLFVISSSLFIYYISDLRNKLTAESRIFWRVFAGIIVIGSIVWGFSVLGSPRTQRLIKYDEQKVSDLQNLSNQITSYYSNKNTLPVTIAEIANGNYYITKLDSQTQKPYEYVKISDTTYNLCAEFNKDSKDSSTNTNMPVYDNYGIASWVHPAGHYCFNESVRPNNVYPPNSVPLLKGV